MLVSISGEPSDDWRRLRVGEDDESREGSGSGEGTMTADAIIFDRQSISYIDLVD